MLIIDIPVLPALKPLIKAINSDKVEIYLHGYLGKNLIFVDIDWDTAGHLQTKLSPPWTLIYAYFISGEALDRGEPDPLSPEANVRDILDNYKPDNRNPLNNKEDYEDLLERAEYLLQFPPSRLVYLGKQITNEDLSNIEEIFANLPN